MISATAIEKTTALVKAADAAVRLKLRLQRRAYERAAYEAIHLKKVEKVEADLQQSLEPLFENQIRSTAKQLKKMSRTKDEWGGEASTLTKKVFDPSEWDEELINRALPPMAKAMAEEMLRTLKELGVTIPSRVLRAKAFCPTGQGGGVDPTCSPSQSGAGKPGKLSIDTLDRVSEWREHLWNRAIVTRLAKRTVKGGDLEEFHPGEITVYRGKGFRSSSAKGKSWSKSREVAEAYADGGKVVELKLTSNMPALDINKLLEGRPSKSESDMEVFVVASDKSFVGSKASTASEWLNDWDIDLEDVVFATPSGNISMGFATEYPQWMKDEIRTRLQESFDQDYWAKVNQTTFGDIDGFLKKGLNDGWSIKKMADEIVPQLMNQGHYAEWRAKNIARTESGHALNSSRVASADKLIAEIPELPMKKVWLSVLGTTTRRTHADLDGVPADNDGMWKLAGIKVRWPGDTVLPPSERCQCQCTVLTEFGLDDTSAQELIDEYSARVMEDGNAEEQPD